MKKLITICAVLYVLVSMPTLLRAAPANGLEGYWSGNGNTLDQSGNGRNGWINGSGVTYTAGKVGQAFDFTGHGWVEVADSPAWNVRGYDMTIALWANFDIWGYSTAQEGLWPTLISQDEGGGENPKWMLFLEHDRSMRFLSTGNVASFAPVSFNLGEWHHIAVTKNGSQLTEYIDAQPVATSSFNNNAVHDVSAPLRIGWGEDSFRNIFAMVGSIDEVYFYSRALSSSEIADVSGIPEPATICLLGLGGLGLLRRKRDNA